MIEIIPKENDDKDFSRIVEKILHGFLQNHSPDKLYLVEIDNWFDSKWKKFAGKILGIAGVRSEELVVPPFIPSRVLEQFLFQRTGDNYEKQREVYLHIYQPSEENLNRKIKSSSESVMLFWFSGNTQNSLRGSIMIYYVEPEKQYSWFLSFLKKDSWQVYKTDGISRNEVLALL